MIECLIIPGTLPGANEYISAERRSRYKAAELKREAQWVVMLRIREQLRGVHFTGPVVLHYKWVEPDRRRDKDNIAFAHKFVQDALVAGGVLDNDGWRWVAGFSDDFDLDPTAPRVEVTIEGEGERV